MYPTQATTSIPPVGIIIGIQIKDGLVEEEGLAGIEGWNGQQDGSLHTTGRKYPYEVVSPILRGTDGIGQVGYICLLMDEIRASVNSSCGIHVHVDARNLTDEQIGNVKANFARWEMAFYGTTGKQISKRMNGTYAQPTWRSSEMNRYRSLNLTNLGKRDKRTLEFRLFAGSTKVEDILTAIFMCVGLVSYSTKTKFSSSERINDPVVAFGEFLTTVLMDTDNQVTSDYGILGIVQHGYHKCQEAHAKLNEHNNVSLPGDIIVAMNNMITHLEQVEGVAEVEV